MLLLSFRNFEILSCLPWLCALLQISSGLLVRRALLSFCVKALLFTLMLPAGQTAQLLGVWSFWCRRPGLEF